MIRTNRRILLIWILFLCSVSAERSTSSLHRRSDALPQHYYQQQPPPPPRRLWTDSSEQDGTIVAVKPLSRAWPPWPFNLLSSSRNDSNHDNNQVRPHYHYSDWKHRAWQHTRESLKAAARNTQQLTSSLYMHLPPAAHPFLLLASLPYRGKPASRRLYQRIPILADPFARSIGLAAVGMAIVSWAHCDWYRRKSIAPLPLVHHHSDVHRAILPPFLPEEVQVLPAKRNEWTTNSHNHPKEVFMPKETNEKERKALGSTGGWRQQWNSFRHQTSTKWPFHHYLRKTRQERHFERLQERRRVIYDELVALQTLKQKRAAPSSLLQKVKKMDQSRRMEENPQEDEPLGYALVTGASRGIGRAIAVELARWEIPLILVARNIDRLIALANDLEHCYGVKCCVLEADLSQPHVAERVYKTTQDAGLRVDILVNNAGMLSHGIAVDQPVQEVNRMLQLNACSSAILSNLFGHDMKKRRRGRILFVSSVSGTVAGISTVALYSATKAFQNSLAVAMAKEMGPWGVGVTCLMPGAVEDTDFSKTSKTDQALCWKLPFYPRKPQLIAKLGVRAMLLGETEVVPGWQNRFFVKVLKPVLPQRLHNVIAEIVWNPLRLPFQKSVLAADSNENPAYKEAANLPPNIPPGSSNHVFSQPKLERLPRMLLLDSEPTDDEDEEQEADEHSSSPPQDDDVIITRPTEG